MLKHNRTFCYFIVFFLFCWRGKREPRVLCLLIDPTCVLSAGCSTKSMYSLTRECLRWPEVLPNVIRDMGNIVLTALKKISRTHPGDHFTFLVLLPAFQGPSDVCKENLCSSTIWDYSSIGALELQPRPLFGCCLIDAVIKT